MEGVIRTIKQDKGYGFITGSNKQDYFFHANDIVGDSIATLVEGQAVTFQPFDNAPKGRRAQNIEVVETSGR